MNKPDIRAELEEIHGELDSIQEILDVPMVAALAKLKNIVDKLDGYTLAPISNETIKIEIPNSIRDDIGREAIRLFTDKFCEGVVKESGKSSQLLAHEIKLASKRFRFHDDKKTMIKNGEDSKVESDNN